MNIEKINSEGSRSMNEYNMAQSPAIYPNLVLCVVKERTDPLFNQVGELY